MIDKIDRQILKSLRMNGRKSYSEIAREMGLSPAGVQQRVIKLQANGIVRNFEAHVEPSVLGLDACALVGATVNDRSKIEDLILRLEEIPTITECHFTTGRNDIIFMLYGKNNDDIFAQLLKLQELGLSNTETLISFRCAFKRPIPV